jgi:hypothetical protein
MIWMDQCYVGSIAWGCGDCGFPFLERRDDSARAGGGDRRGRGSDATKRMSHEMGVLLLFFRVVGEFVRFLCI